MMFFVIKKRKKTTVLRSRQSMRNGRLQKLRMIAADETGQGAVPHPADVMAAYKAHLAKKGK
jgi:hypothetical protein